MNHENMKMTEVGWIPKDWECNLFEDVLSTFTTGSTPYRGIPEYYQGNEKWVSSGELNYNIISDTHEHITREAIRDSNLKVHEVGTFLMAITGLEAEGTRGKCAILGVPATTNQSCLAINSTDRMTTDYLFHYYQHFSNWYAFKYSQGTKQQSYKAEIVKKFPIIHPALLSEQRRIAQVLSDTDSLIASLSRTIEKKRLVKQGAMQQLLTGKTRLKGFSGEWVEKKVSSLGKFYGGGTPSTQIEEYWKGTIPWISSSDLRENDIIHISKSRFITVEAVANSATKIVPKNSILIVTRVGLGKVAVSNTDICTSQDFSSINLFEDELYFIAYSLMNLVKDIKEEAQGTSIKGIDLTALKECVLSVPPSYNEQFAISERLRTMDNEIASLEAELQKYKSLKQGMMQKLLTGQIRLTNSTK